MIGPLILLILVAGWATTLLISYYRLTKTIGWEEAKLYLYRFFLKSTRQWQSEIIKEESLAWPLIIRFGEVLLVAVIICLSLQPGLIFLSTLAILLGSWIYLFLYLGAKGPKQAKNWRKLFLLPTGFAILEITLTINGIGQEWLGSTLGELNLRKKDLLVLAILRSTETICFPKGQESLHIGDRVLIFGRCIPTLLPETKIAPE